MMIDSRETLHFLFMNQDTFANLLRTDMFVGDKVIQRSD
jgi:hypothetical protein